MQKCEQLFRLTLSQPVNETPLTRRHNDLRGNYLLLKNATEEMTIRMKSCSRKYYNGHYNFPHEKVNPLTIWHRLESLLPQNYRLKCLRKA